MRKDVYQIITDRIIALLESGTIPWRKPWKGGGPPQNLISRKAYRGINVFLLNATRFASPFWLSFKQVQSIGAMVRKGEHAFPVVFWKLREVEGDGKENEQKPKKRAPLLRYYKVFNGLDIQKNFSSYRLVWLMPLFALLVLVLNMARQNTSFLRRIAGLCPFAILVYAMNRLGNDLPKYLEGGGWLALVAGAALVLIPGEPKPKTPA